MYVHLGNNVVVRDKDIIGIFDIENTSVGKLTKEYFLASGKRKSAVNVSFDMPRAFVTAEYHGKERVYISPVLSSTLIKRAKSKKNKFV